MHPADFLGHAAAHPAVHQALAALPPFPPDCRCLLLSGPERSGKTSLLFHAALSAARRGQSVLLLCRRCVHNARCGLRLQEGGRSRRNATGMRYAPVPLPPTPNAAGASWRRCHRCCQRG